MIDLLTCESCGRKLSPDAAKSAGGKKVCPPCYDKARQVVEEKRRREAEEKKTTASKAKMEAAKVKAISRLAERGIDVMDVIDKPVILPPSDVLPAVKKSDRAESEVKRMLASAGVICLLARIAAVVLLVAAALTVAGGIFGGLEAAKAAGTLGFVVLGVSTLVAAASLALPGLLLWFLGGWVKRFTALFAKHLAA
jgi:hypothetical protein